MSVLSVMTALADAVRALTNGSSALSLEGMSAALNAIPKKGAATIQPGQSVQTIAANQLLTGAQTIGKAYATGTITVGSDALQTIAHNLGRVPAGFAIAATGSVSNGVAIAVCINGGIQATAYYYSRTWSFEELTSHGGFLRNADAATLQAGCPGWINLARTTFQWFVW